MIISDLPTVDHHAPPPYTRRRQSLTYTGGRAVLADEDAAYIRSRSARYPGALDIEPDWTQEVLTDARLVELSPYPNSRVGATGLIDYSPSADKVLVVIANRDLDGDLHGMNAWPVSGRDQATYQREGDHGQDS